MHRNVDTTQCKTGVGMGSERRLGGSDIWTWNVDLICTVVSCYTEPLPYRTSGYTKRFYLVTDFLKLKRPLYTEPALQFDVGYTERWNDRTTLPPYRISLNGTPLHRTPLHTVASLNRLRIRYVFATH